MQSTYNNKVKYRQNTGSPHFSGPFVMLNVEDLFFKKINNHLLKDLIIIYTVHLLNMAEKTKINLKF